MSRERRGDDVTPIIGATMGDPAGVGPEITALSLARLRSSDARAVAYGDQRVLQRAVDLLNLDVTVRPVSSPEETKSLPNTIYVIDCAASPELPSFGRVSAEGGRSAIKAIERAVQDAVEGSLDAIATAPINKESIWAAGSPFLGHTEMLGSLTGSDRYQTMFMMRSLKIFFTTRHLSLREALGQITTSTLDTAIRRTWESLIVLGMEAPRLAVAALNPHGGEGGAFGHEEKRVIGPACEKARDDGMDVRGPIPADSVFHQALAGRFDAVLSQYHDQGHIAAKTVDFEGTVSVTMGLPIIRTSVDHGTAFDIAGTGQASSRGMSAAIGKAIELAPLKSAFYRAYSGS